MSERTSDPLRGYRRARWLLVDDNPGDVDLIRRAFDSRSLSVSRSGVDALARLKRQAPYASEPPPNVVLLDLHLPGRDGHAVLADIRSDEQLSLVPVIIFSSSASPDDVNRAYRYGANCFVRKPIALDELENALRKVITFWSEVVEIPWR